MDDDGAAGQGHAAPSRLPHLLHHVDQARQAGVSLTRFRATSGVPDGVSRTQRNARDIVQEALPRQRPPRYVHIASQSSSSDRSISESTIILFDEQPRI
jgi:hypothetical protein